jgi:putative colanic acid polymerase
MGSLYNVVASYQLFQFGAEQSVSLDNGIYVLIFYFGWLGLVSIFVISVWALFAKSSTVGQSIIGDRQVRIWVLLSLLFSGAIFAPEFSIVTFLVLACWKAGRKHESVA